MRGYPQYSKPEIAPRVFCKEGIQEKKAPLVQEGNRIWEWQEGSCETRSRCGSVQGKPWCLVICARPTSPFSCPPPSLIPGPPTPQRAPGPAAGVCRSEVRISSMKFPVSLLVGNLCLWSRFAPCLSDCSSDAVSYV